MWSYIGLGALVTVGLWASTIYSAFAKNLAAAKSSNIPYIVVPVYYFGLLWLSLSPLILPYIRKLPKKWTESWLVYVEEDWQWREKHEIYRILGSDTFMTVSPGGNMVWTADATAISEIANRRNDFPKPIYMYQLIDIFGKNVISTEGQTWRQHRKITSPPFTEKNNQMVWSESLHQTKSMLKSWTGPSGTPPQTIKSLNADTMRLSLNMISRAGFGVRLPWPGVEDEQEKVPGMTEGHTMTFVEAMTELVERLFWIVMVPHWLLKRLPFAAPARAWQCFSEWSRYMHEMCEAKKLDIIEGRAQEDGMDLLGAVIKGANVVQPKAISNGAAKSAANGSALEKGQQPDPPIRALSDPEIFGNAFVFLLAGHETTANSIHFSILLLAIHPHAQRALQRDIDRIFGSRPVSEWDYERDVPELFSGLVGAVLNEELRIIPPVVAIPKYTKANQPQAILVDGKPCTVPGGTVINLNVCAVQRNPKYWPSSDPNVDAATDLHEFRPERWLTESNPAYACIQNPPVQKHMNGHANGTAKTPSINGSCTSKISIATTDSNSNDLTFDSAPDTSAQLYRPPKGAYIPFSEGFRSCLGRRFAQVEVLAVLAVIFSQYSVELAVDEYASDAEVEKMSPAEKRAVYEKSRARAKNLLDKGMSTLITLRMRSAEVGVRFIKRGSGQERFAFEDES
ncbi:MAG: hypothetical protein MMC33_005137 [Icmadophila ericetorum]|nr:hypothetical protein [Icmadophila ericetorum]